MLVAVDKFTKWVEAAPVTTQDSTTAINFIKFIVFRFGVPHSIIIDNGTNFTSKEFKSYCESILYLLIGGTIGGSTLTLRQ
jgi:hypothetical protein